VNAIGFCRMPEKWGYICVPPLPLGGLVVRLLDSGPRGREFNSRPVSYQVDLIPRLHNEAGSTSWLYERSSSARRAGLMSWLSGHLNGVILQINIHEAARRALDERS